MSVPAIVWLVVGLTTLIAVLATLIALIRHVLVLGRAARRFQDEVGPLAQGIASEGEHASGRAQRLSAERRPRGS